MRRLDDKIGRLRHSVDAVEAEAKRAEAEIERLRKAAVKPERAREEGFKARYDKGYSAGFGDAVKECRRRAMRKGVSL